MNTDIVFISYKESNGDKNWIELKSKFPQAKRVHGINGIKRAHEKAAEISETEFFFVVDGDNRIKDSFNFELKEIKPQEDTLYVWRCENPVNNLIYGFGAIKLYNKSLLRRRKENYVDLATTITEKYHIVHEVASETHFFVTPEEAWRGAFRECAKLSSQIIHGQKSKETEERLKVWCEFANNIENRDWCLIGAKAGVALGGQIKNDPKAAKKINDYQWMYNEFSKYQ